MNIIISLIIYIISTYLCHYINIQLKRIKLRKASREPLYSSISNLHSWFVAFFTGPSWFVAQYNSNNDRRRPASSARTARSPREKRDSFSSPLRLMGRGLAATLASNWQRRATTWWSEGAGWATSVHLWLSHSPFEHSPRRRRPGEAGGHQQVSFALIFESSIRSILIPQLSIIREHIVDWILSSEIIYALFCTL
jgi:hypothetical protein